MKRKKNDLIALHTNSNCLLNRFENGAGSFVFGTSMMLVCMFIYILFVYSFLIHENTVNTQCAIDALADGVAVYMDARTYEDNSDDYTAALAEAERLREIISEHTGIYIDRLTIDPAKLEDSIVRITGNHSTSVISIGGDSVFDTSRTAATEYGVGNDYIRYALQAVGNPYLTYSQDTRNTWYYNTGANPRTHTICQADCSSFVHACLYKTRNIQLSPEMNQGNSLATPSMGQALLASGWHRVNASSLADLKKGDILNNPGAFSAGHVRIYLGNGTCVEMTGSNNGVAVNHMGGYDPRYDVYRKN